ncbi:MAG TPA: hypothetical protein VNG51_03400 [Ktedonobacteraceae bacterium]|nr:hypothetical protein [Ktedonobacteraceae bacterium]
MRIFENPEDEVLFLSREDQVPLAKEPRISPWTELLSPAQKEALPLELFPIIEDFELILIKSKCEPGGPRGGNYGDTIWAFSASSKGCSRVLACWVMQHWIILKKISAFL